MPAAISDGEMYILRDPVVYETTTGIDGEVKDYDRIRDNRTAVQNGSDFEPDQYFNTECCQVLRCIAAVPGDATGAPDLDLATVVWVRDEEELSHQPNRIEIVQLDATYDELLNITRFHTDLRLTPFLQSRDTGVYQCLFFNYGNYREVVTTTPIRLDSGKLFWDTMPINAHFLHCSFTAEEAPAQLTAVSPYNVVNAPSEKLVIEVESTGGYFRHAWFKNNEEIYPNGDSTFMQDTPQEFSEFFQVYVKDPITPSDYGVYRVELIDSSNQTIQSVDFISTPFGKLVSYAEG